MTKPPPYKPKVIQVSPHETLIIFPKRSGRSIATSCNLPFEEIKHLLTDWPLRPPYRGQPTDKLNGKPRRQPGRKPKLSGKRRRKPRTE